MKQQPTFRIALIDLVTLLYNVHRGAQDEEQVGFEDCERTLQQLTKDLSPVRARVDRSALESGLWSCNLMDEVGEFWSPKDESFDRFLNRVLRYASPQERLEFDKFFNLIRKKQ